MASAFDPYLQWLGIRDPQRPPNHYRLLGLELFENDASVIAMSADRQMAHLRNFKTGPEADVAERLLNELSAARICLLKPERKVAYDNHLRAAMKPAVAKPLPVAAPAKISTAATMPTIAPVVRTSGSSVRAMPAKAAWKPWAILATLIILCGGLVTVLVNKNQPANGEKIAVAEDNEESKTLVTKNKVKPQSPVKPAEMTTVTKNSPANLDEPKTTDSSIAKPESPKKTLPVDTNKKATTKPQPEKASGSNNKKPSNEPLSSPDAASPPDLTSLLGEQVDSKGPEKSTDQETSLEKPSRNSDPMLLAQAPLVEPPKLVRLPIPDKPALTAKEKDIREIFAEEYKSQKPEVKSALAAKLHQSSTDSNNDSAMKYVLLNEARSNAVLGGSVKLAVEITDEIVRDYDVSESDEIFTLFTKLLSGGNRNAAYGQLVIDELRRSVAKLQENDEYDLALKLVNMAQAAARNIRDPALVTELTQRAKEINLQKAAFLRAKVAKDNLAKSPNDPAANELWGAYLSFTKGEFNAGLPFLARGSSAELADLAARELDKKQAQADQLSLADDWWAYGEKLQSQDSVRSVNIRQHAGQKYVSLYPKLTGIDKAKAEKRINELKKISDQKSKRDLDQMMAQLVSTKWQVDFPNGGQPEFMVFRPDGTMTNRVFSTWVIENNELVLKGNMLGKIKFNYVGFDVDYYHLNGRLDYQGKAKPMAQ